MMRKIFLAVAASIFLCGPLHAQQAGSNHLTSSEIQRVKAVKELLSVVDKKPLRMTIVELEKTRDPEINLEIREAMAQAYTDVVRDYKVEGQKKKEWLYSMVCLNMAYLQFGGQQPASGDSNSLNKLIRQELKKHLSPEVLRQSGFLYSL
jgi:hypothetical protein